MIERKYEKNTYWREKCDFCVGYFLIYCDMFFYKYLNFWFSDVRNDGLIEGREGCNSQNIENANSLSMSCCN